MSEMWKAIIWRQFGAAMDMLENAIRHCPEKLWSRHLWNERSQQPGLSEFWYVAYHTLFWLDLYLSGSVEGFIPPAPFTLDELDPAGVLPERQYSSDELLSYLDHSRKKCQAALMELTDEKAHQLCKFTWGEVTYAELLLDNMRHVQEHAAQLSMLLGQEADSAARWVAGLKTGLDND